GARRLSRDPGRHRGRALARQGAARVRRAEAGGRDVRARARSETDARAEPLLRLAESDRSAETGRRPGGGIAGFEASGSSQPDCEALARTTARAPRGRCEALARAAAMIATALLVGCSDKAPTPSAPRVGRLLAA